MKIAIIPARGGSKRIPRKNIKDFCGKPIIAYSIQACMETGLFDQVIVSTDDEEIASKAKEWGASVPFIRPKELSDDYTGTNSVIKHAVDWLNDKGQIVEHVCCVYATAPFVQSKYLIEGFEKLISEKSTFSFSVTSFPFPIQRAVRINHSGRVEAIYPQYIDSRSQDIEESYHDAGQFYWGTASGFINDVTMFSPDSVPIMLPRHLVQDIDTPEDWLHAELMYKTWLNSDARNL
ncbi:MAG: pseudaminic acid cytidylyltransferase [Nitrosopumilus sp.]|nr:pseudaminic acid cytidylyltransferase [Gammaproteobacteria bacterium]MDH5665065.1 pseudaminic acid cytidylyltransferase [Nitrosopumilus sp.]